MGDDDRGDRKEGRARGLQPAPADERERFWRRVRTPIIGKILDPHGLPGYVIADVNRRRDEAGRFEIRVRVDEALD